LREKLPPLFPPTLNNQPPWPTARAKMEQSLYRYTTHSLQARHGLSIVAQDLGVRCWRRIPRIDDPESVLQA
jgi:hypothetical protein